MLCIHADASPYDIWYIHVYVYMCMMMIRIFHIWVMLVVLEIDIMSFSRLGSLECIYIYNWYSQHHHGSCEYSCEYKFRNWANSDELMRLDNLECK